MKIVLVSILLLLFLPLDGIAQDYLGTGFYFGKVVKHKEELSFDIPPRSLQFQLAHKQKVAGNEYWHHFYGQPNINHLYQFVNFGDDEVLGQGHALMKGLDFPILQSRKFSWEVSVYSGIGYISQPFDRVDNPLNNAIGSHLNNATRIGSSVNYPLHDHLDLNLNVHLLHFSNGLSQSPNSGINTWGIGLECFYRLNKKKEVDELPSKPIVSNPWVLDINWQFSRSELPVPGGPKYPNHVLAIGGGWQYHPLLTIFMGINYEYRSGQYESFIRDFLSKEEARDRATRTALYIAHEFTFKHLVVRPQIGYYLPYPMEGSEDYYIKMGTLYFFPKIYNIQPYVGVVLKSHSAVAEYVALSTGLRYRL